MSKRSLILTLLPLLVVLLAVGCDRRQLEVDLTSQVRVKVVVNWKVNYAVLYDGELPTGMTVRIWDSRNRLVVNEATNDDYVYASLMPGTYRMMIFNETSDDYIEENMQFFDYDDFDECTLRSRKYTRQSSALAAGKVHLVPPSWPRMAVAADTISVSADMARRDTVIFVDYEDYRANGYQAEMEYERLFEVEEEPWPMTVDVLLKLKVKHHERLRYMECSLSGMADGFYLSHIVRTKETGSLWFKPDYAYWGREPYGDEADETEMIYTRVASFGLPNGKELTEERNADDNVLSLRLTLTDGKTYDLHYDVGKVLEYITPEGNEQRIRYRQDLQNLRLVLELPDLLDLPEVEPSKEETMFDVEVGEWENGGDINFGGF